MGSAAGAVYVAAPPFVVVIVPKVLFPFVTALIDHVTFVSG